jgi:hypothetical protein
MWHVRGRGAYRVLGGKPEGKRPLGRAGRRWEEDLQEWGSVAWTGSGNGQVVGCCECGNEPSGSIKCGGFLE